MERESVQIIKFLKAIMIFSGSWRLKLTNNKLMQTLYNVYSVIFQFSFLCFNLTLMVNIPSLLKKQEYQMVAENVGYSIITLVMLIKVVISQSSKVRNLILQCIIEEIRIYKDEPEIIQNKFTKQIKVLNRVNSVALLMGFGMMVTYCTAKYVDYAAYKKLNVSDGRPLPMPVWYPFDTDEHYGLAFFVAAYFNVVGSINVAVTQVLFYTLMTFVALQIKVLKIRVMDFHIIDTTQEKNKENTILAVIRDICIKHQSIISNAEELNAAINYVLLLEFILNSLNIASVMIQIIIMPYSSLMAFIVVFLITQVVQLFLMSWHANEIEVESISLADTLFQSKWYEQSEKAKKMISFIMLRSKKPLSLFIGPFYPMTNSTALSTIKVAYSYMTLIVRMASDE